jgi:hypothetical protein
MDYDSHEIITVNGDYIADSKDIGNFTYLNYRDVSLSIHFKDFKQFTINNLAKNRPGRKSDVGSGLMASGLQLNHQFILVMRDGVSYRVQPPLISYYSDHLKPGYIWVESRGSLRERTGKYIFVRPEPARATLLKPQPQSVDIRLASQGSIHVLEGQASSYDIYPGANSTIRLSTPGATAKTSNASTWNFYTQHLGPNIGREHIKINNDQLWIDRINVQLPDNKDVEVPLETINIVTSSGNIYKILYEFNSILLSTINARGYSSVDAILSDVRKHKQDEQLAAAPVRIHHIGLTNLTPGNIYYDSQTDNWTIDTDWSRSLSSAELSILRN